MPSPPPGAPSNPNQMPTPDLGRGATPPAAVQVKQEAKASLVWLRYLPKAWYVWFDFKPCCLSSYTNVRMCNLSEQVCLKSSTLH